MPGAVHRLERERRSCSSWPAPRTCSPRSSGGGRRSRRSPRRRGAASSPRRSRGAILAPAEILELVPDHHPLRVPERRARRLLREVEEVELRRRAAGGRAAAPPRAARGARRGRPASRTRCRRCGSAACSARRRASTRRRAPVSLNALIGPRVLEVRAAAEVGEVALRVERDPPSAVSTSSTLYGSPSACEPPRAPRRREISSRRPLAPLRELAPDLRLDPLEVGLA